MFSRLSGRDQHHEPTGSREDDGRRRQVYAGNNIGPFRPGAHDVLPGGGPEHKTDGEPPWSWPSRLLQLS